MPIGDLRYWSGIIRELVTVVPQLLGKRLAQQKWYEAALRGEVESYVVLDPFKKLGVPGFTRERLPPEGSYVWLPEDKLLATLRANPGAIVLNVRKIIAPFVE